MMIKLQIMGDNDFYLYYSKDVVHYNIRYINLLFLMFYFDNYFSYIQLIPYFEKFLLLYLIQANLIKP